MRKKKPYGPPRLTAYDPKNVPEWLNLMQQDLLKGANVPPTYTAVVDQYRSYLHVSKSFAELVGYMHGLWMLVHRTGYHILIRYEAWLRPDSNIQSNIEVARTFV